MPSATTPATAKVPREIRITEVSAWGSGFTPYASDWFELTNFGKQEVAVAGWKMDDDSRSFTAGALLQGVSKIGPGESVLFVESANGAAINTFRSVWGIPPSVQVGFYSGPGVGLSTTGDAVAVYQSDGVLLATVAFGPSPGPGNLATFDNSIGENQVTLVTLTDFSRDGAITASDGTVGSPGRVLGGTSPTPTPSPTPTFTPATPISPTTSPSPVAVDIFFSGAGSGSVSFHYPGASGILTGPATLQPPAGSTLSLTLLPNPGSEIAGSQASGGVSGYLVGFSGDFSVGTGGAIQIGFSRLLSLISFTVTGPGSLREGNTILANGSQVSIASGSTRSFTAVSDTVGSFAWSGACFGVNGPTCTVNGPNSLQTLLVQVAFSPTEPSHTPTNVASPIAGTADPIFHVSVTKQCERPEACGPLRVTFYNGASWDESTQRATTQECASECDFSAKSPSNYFASARLEVVGDALPYWTGDASKCNFSPRIGHSICDVPAGSKARAIALRQTQMTGTNTIQCADVCGSDGVCPAGR